MKHLSKINLDHPDLHDVDLATHVVTGVLYGAEAFFVFDRTITKDEDKRDISGTLKVLINKIPTFKVEGEGKLNMNDQQQKFVDRLNCKFYGDFQLSENPSTFADAIRIYRELPKLLGNKSESAVPKKVWLYPLSLLDNKGMRVVRDISSKLIDYTISILENLHSTEVTALDLSRDAIFTHFDHMKNHLLDFTARLSEFQRVLKEKIVLYLPQLRGNTGVQESVLFNLFKRVDSSPFNKRTLESWLNEKRQVISLVTSLLETLVEHKKLNVTIKSSSLHGINFDSYYDYTFCLSLRFVEENDPHLTDMHNYLYGNSSFKSSKSHQNNKTWFTDHRFMAKIRKDFRQFTDFAKANNVENRKIKFIVDEEYAVNHLKSTQLILYDDESEKVGFILPSKPSAPYVKNVTENNVTLGWTDGVNGSEKIIKYKVMYRQYISKLSDDRNENETAGKWITMETSDNRQEIIISNLSPTITFEFQAQSVTAIGLSVVSDLSERVTMPGVKALLSNLPIDARWGQNGKTVAGGNGQGGATNQIYRPLGLFVDDNQTMIIADHLNHRLIQWKMNNTNGEVVAGGNGRGNRLDQLDHPTDVLIDKETDNFVICDRGNRRVLRWSRRSGPTQGEILIENINCYGLFMDDQSYLFVTDIDKHGVKRYQIRDKNEIVVAGGNGKGVGLNQIDFPTYIFVDRQQNVYISDHGNHRIMKWTKGAKEGTIVAGGQGEGNALTQLSHSCGIFVDTLGTVYVADAGNNRVMRWPKGANEGTIVVGGNGMGAGVDQFNSIDDLSFNRQGNLYVVDHKNDRVQFFSLK
ncbi:unnamed protein product [Rotaria sp. Silwood2]|nr:unnamed protein product [Rotaria sp. Silwood2]CAF4491019.1 unnamed protein product [Rotaria sp. Silwood2]